MKQFSNLAKFMFCMVAVLLVITVVLGIATAIKEGNKKQETSGNHVSVTPIATPSPAPIEPTETPVPDNPMETPTPTPSPSPEPRPKVVIDPGHQKAEVTEKEPIGPGSDTMKSKMSYGSTSTTTGKREYLWTLPMAHNVKEKLEARGYEVVLTRESHDVNISNAERALLANESGADIYICLQLDSYTQTSVAGIYSQIPSAQNPFISHLHESSKLLAEAIQKCLVAETGARDRGVRTEDNSAAINWSQIPVVVLQLGYMSSPDEDAKLWQEEYQNKIATAICDGIDEYFGY